MFLHRKCHTRSVIDYHIVHFTILGMLVLGFTDVLYGLEFCEMPVAGTADTGIGLPQCSHLRLSQLLSVSPVQCAPYAPVPRKVDLHNGTGTAIKQVN